MEWAQEMVIGSIKHLKNSKLVLQKEWKTHKFFSFSTFMVNNCKTNQTFLIMYFMRAHTHIYITTLIMFNLIMTHTHVHTHNSHIYGTVREYLM